MAKAKRSRTSKPPAASRSRKAGRPPESPAVAPRVRRRQKSATAAYRKDTTIHQAAAPPRILFAATRPITRKPK